MFFQKVNLKCNRQIHHYIWTENDENLYIGLVESDKITCLYRKYNLDSTDMIKLYVDTGIESWSLEFLLEGGSSYYYKSEIVIELKFEMIDGREELNVYVNGEYSCL
jgi:hypothetical protein